MSMEWQPIETAQPPKYAKVITYWPGNEKRNPVVIINEYNPMPRQLGSCDWWNSRPDQKPTHWMPLPLPPTKETT